MIKFLIGGSPCTLWSCARNKNRETKAEGLGWELFRNFLIAKEKWKPDFFLYENNKSAAVAIKEQISLELDAPLQYINSALVSAQNRARFYCHNFGDIPLPQDRGILLKDILESGLVFRSCKGEKSYCLDASYYKGGNLSGFNRQSGKRLMVAEPAVLTDQNKAVYEVKNGLITVKNCQYPVILPDGFYKMRLLTLTECCRLQTLPDDYCRAVSPARGYKGLGNGWSAEVIIHLLSYALKGIPKSEEIVVLSMYDGIGTGRYCFDKLGYKNIRYYAYEIDKYAIQVAMSNFPDIIQRGDAFGVRENKL